VRVYFSLFVAALALNLATKAAMPADWQFSQPFSLSQTGLVKLSLPLETLNAGRQGLEDLRLLDSTGREVPFLIERVRVAGNTARPAASFRVTLQVNRTVMTLETGSSQPIEGLTVATPALSFMKAVTVEGSNDGAGWQTVGQGLPLFRQRDGPSQLYLPLPPGAWRDLRLTIDDRRSEAIPLSGVTVHAIAEPMPVEPVAAVIGERVENPGQTRIAVKLPAANLQLSRLEIESPEPLFTRQMTLAAQKVSENALKEQPLASGTIYRLNREDQPLASQMIVPVEALCPTREVVMLVQNQDSPPLALTAVRFWRRPIYLVFLSPRAGTYQLLSGNYRCDPPRYDLDSLSGRLTNAPPASTTFSPLANNPAFAPSEVVPTAPDAGVPLETGAWKYRKPIRISEAGIQQIELDLEVLCHAEPELDDLRLVRSGRQVPYLLEQTSIDRPINVPALATNDSKRPNYSRWLLTLPYPSLPVTKLTCTAATPMFQRDFRLFEEAPGERGEKYLRPLGQASWTRTSGEQNRSFAVLISPRPLGKILILETDNRDNPAVDLGEFKGFYPAARIYFKSATNSETFLYYGNQQASFPQYDLRLIAQEILAAPKSIATLAAEESLQKSTWAGKFGVPGSGGPIFWVVLGLVVVVLLLLISRLLPGKTPPDALR
jgi:hypothetical protein